MNTPPSAQMFADNAQVCTPATAYRLEVLRMARDSRGALFAVPERLASAVVALAEAEFLEVDAMGYRLTGAGVIFLARIEALRAL